MKRPLVYSILAFRNMPSHDRVAVVFGMDDEKACAAIAQALLDAHGERWRCTPAN